MDTRRLAESYFTAVNKGLELDVSEFLKFDESDKLIASTIYFDTHRFQEFMQGR